jgi:hypothetical protein
MALEWVLIQNIPEGQCEYIARILAHSRKVIRSTLQG